MGRLVMHGEGNAIKYISKLINEWTDDTSRIAIIFEERENLKSEKFPDEKFGQSFLTLK